MLGRKEMRERCMQLFDSGYASQEVLLCCWRCRTPGPGLTPRSPVQVLQKDKLQAEAKEVVFSGLCEIHKPSHAVYPDDEMWPKRQVTLSPHPPKKECSQLRKVGED